MSSPLTPAASQATLHIPSFVFPIKLNSIDSPRRKIISVRKEKTQTWELVDKFTTLFCRLASQIILLLANKGANAINWKLWQLPTSLPTGSPLTPAALQATQLVPPFVFTSLANLNDISPLAGLVGSSPLPPSTTEPNLTDKEALPFPFSPMAGARTTEPIEVSARVSVDQHGQSMVADVQSSLLVIQWSLAPMSYFP